jgi:hypothetical protein
MEWWTWLLIAIGVVIVILLAVSLGDIRRYMRIRTM